MRGYTGQVQAHFGDTFGRPLRHVSQRYRSASSNVAAWEEIKPAHDTAQYDDFELFLPYDQLRLEPGKNDRQFYITVLVRDGRSWKTLWATAPVPFWVKGE